MLSMDAYLVKIHVQIAGLVSTCTKKSTVCISMDCNYYFKLYLLVVHNLLCMNVCASLHTCTVHVCMCTFKGVCELYTSIYPQAFPTVWPLTCGALDAS